MRIQRIGVADGKGRAASFREATYYNTQSQKIARLNKVIGISEFETTESGDWVLKIWEGKGHAQDQEMGTKRQNRVNIST
jgi:hypothetical protein